MPIITGVSAQPDGELQVPTPGSDDGTWGTFLNGTTFQKIANNLKWLSLNAAPHQHGAADIDATGITDGFVLTANGAGVAGWEAPPAGGGGGGAATQLDADGTILDVNAVTDGAVLMRTGTTVVASKAAPSGDFVGTSGIQTITSKTIAASVLRGMSWDNLTATWDGVGDTISVGTHNYQKVTVTAATAPTIAGTLGAAGQTHGYVIRIQMDATGYHPITWPASFKWATTPLDTSLMGPNEYCFLMIETWDGSTTFEADHTRPAFTDVLEYAISAEDADATVGTAKLTFRTRYACRVEAVRFNAGSQGPTGTAAIFDINESGVSIFSTRPQIDVGEKTSVTSSVPYVISSPNVADDAEITIDIDQVGSTVAGRGYKVALYVTRT